MIKGLRTAVYPAPDLAKMKAWYAEVLGAQPYFDEPFYVGFNVGGFELGLIPDATPGKDGTQIFWGVDDIESAVSRLTSLGAVLHTAVQDVGEGIKVATFRDPAGNVLGIIQNPQFDPRKVR